MTGIEDPSMKLSAFNKSHQLSTSPWSPEQFHEQDVGMAVYESATQSTSGTSWFHVMQLFQGEIDEASSLHQLQPTSHFSSPYPFSKEG